MARNTARNGDSARKPSAGSDLGALLTSWSRHLRAANLSPRTVQSYLEAAERFRSFLEAENLPTTVGSLRREHVERFVADVLRKHAPATAASRYRSLQQLFRWAVEEGEVDTSPMGGLRSPKVPEQPVAILTNEQLRQLLSSCE
jgi:site-specific recombinase XerD